MDRPPLNSLFNNNEANFTLQTFNYCTTDDRNTLMPALLRPVDYVTNVFTPGLHTQRLSGPP